MIDTTCEDPQYWEKILVSEGLGKDKEDEQEIFELSSGDFLEITNLELLPEEDLTSGDESILQFHGITKDADTLNADHSGLFETNDELRTKIDSDDVYFTGHRIIKLKRGSRECPEWAANNEKIREILLRSFPSLATNETNRKRAGRWARIIQMFYRAHMTRRQIAFELGVPLSTIRSTIQAINRASKGLKANGSGARKGTITDRSDK